MKHTSTKERRKVMMMSGEKYLSPLHIDFFSCVSLKNAKPPKRRRHTYVVCISSQITTAMHEPFGSYSGPPPAPTQTFWAASTIDMMMQHWHVDSIRSNSSSWMQIIWFTSGGSRHSPPTRPHMRSILSKSYSWRG